MTSMRGRGGFMLVTVLVVTAVGLLFGAGALLLFRFQCQMRLERQHELEKVYAVRAALNEVRTFTGEMPEAGQAFRVRTGSDRDLGLVVRPVAPVFPATNHFTMERGDFLLPRAGQYDDARDYEYGAAGTTNLAIGGVNADGRRGLAFGDLAATNGVRWWVNVGMRGTGGWLQEAYGRRYYFWPCDYVDGVGVKDVMRLCLVRNVTNESHAAGRRRGWPLSQEGERALVFEIRPAAGSGDANGDMALYEAVYAGGAVVSRPVVALTNSPTLCNMGLQLAVDKACVFYIGNEIQNKVDDADKLSSRGYVFSACGQLSPETYRYFAEEVTLGGRTYGGVYTNDAGFVQAPELRAVFEVEAASDARGEGKTLDASNGDFLTRFRVTPAYQYDVFLEHPAGVTNLATVAQKVGTYARFGLKYSVLTYDTHGTEHKGFRRDERARARRGGR